MAAQFWDTLNFYKPYGSSARFLLFVLVSYSLLVSLQLLFFLQKFFAELLSLLLQILHSIAFSAFLKTSKTLCINNLVLSTELTV